MVWPRTVKKRGLVGGSALLLLAGALAWWRWPSAPPAPGDAPTAAQTTVDAAPPPNRAPTADAGGAAEAPEAPLAPLPMLTGDVRDATNAGVAQAEVTAALRGADAEEGCATTAHTTSVGGGSFSTAPLCPGQYDVHASRNGLIATAVVHLDRGSDGQVTLRLRAGTQLEVRVIDETRAAVAGAEVEAVERSSGYSRKAITDANGVAVLEGLVPRAHTLLARKAGHIEAWLPDRPLAVGHDRAELVLRRGLSVEGVVVDPGGVPLPGVDLRLGTKSKFANGTLDELLSATSTDGGAFRLGLLRPGPYQVTAQLKGYRRIEKEVRVPGPRQRLVLAPGARLDGVFLDADGQPVDIADISGRTADEQERVHPPYADGGFHAEGLGTGDWTLLGLAKSFDGGAQGVAVAKFTVRDQQSIWVTLELARGEHLAGACVEEDGSPANTDVVAIEEGILRKLVLRGFPMSSAEPGTIGFAACPGQFRLEGLRAGRYTLLACGHDEDAPTFATGTTNARIVCKPKGKLTYRVVDAQGNAVSQYAANGDAATDHPGGRGERTFGGALDEVMTVRARGFAPLQRKVQAAEGQRLDLGDLVLSSERTLKGRVHDANDIPVPDADLRFGVDSPEVAARVRSGDDGTFTFDDVPSTASVVYVHHPGYLPTQQPVAANATTLDVQLTPARRVVGSVVTRDGRSLDGAVVVALRADPAWVERTSDDVGDGRYILGEMPEGELVARLKIHTGAPRLSGFGPVRVAEGAGAADFIERTGGVTFALQPVDSEGAVLDALVWLLPGSVAVGSNPDAVKKRAGLEGLEPDAVQGTQQFTSVPPGRWTAVVFLRRANKVWTAPVEVAPAMPGVLPLVMPAGLY